RSFLELETEFNVLTSTSPVKALEILGQNDIEVIITDYLMPVMNGIEFLLEVKKREIESTFIILTGYADKENAIKAINEVGIYYYVEKPWDNEDLLIIIKNAIERMDLLNEIQKKYDELNKAYISTIYRLTTASEMFDEDTYGHILRISLISEKLAELTGENEEYCSNIKFASMMHDIGKIGIPKELLTKKGKLEPEEFNIIKDHSHIGAVILKNPENQLLEMAKDIAYHHHENWDGKGYPKGLVKESIPKSARIVAIADVFDALLSKRSYKPSLPKEEVLKIIQEETGRQFDDSIADIFLENFDMFIQIYKDVSAMDRNDIADNLFQLIS
ncbi:MAG: HD domain-containing protein, partial [bacterium]|nr:HD domain-containing protein [bacterium]